MGSVNDGQGDRKGAPLLYDDAFYTRGTCIVGAHPCGRPGSQHGTRCKHSQTLVKIMGYLAMGV